MSDVTTRNKANKRRGSRFELDLLAYFREGGYNTERTPRTGTKDEGDLVVRLGDHAIVVEAKATKAINLSEFVAEAKVEADNWASSRGHNPFRVWPLVVVKRRNHGIDKSYAVVELDTLLRLIGL